MSSLSSQRAFRDAFELNTVGRHRSRSLSLKSADGLSQTASPLRSLICWVGSGSGLVRCDLRKAHGTGCCVLPTENRAEAEGVEGEWSTRASLEV